MKTKPPEKIELKAVSLELVRNPMDPRDTDSIKITHKQSNAEAHISATQLENWARRQLREAIK